MSLFSKAHQRMNRIVATRLTDGTGSFTAADGTRIGCLQLAVDSRFEMSGVVETLTGNIKAVSVPKPQLQGVTPVRGDWFELGGKRYLVEDTLSDDHHFPVFACQEMQ
jgi:hypothetical protein